ncbi:MAG TPA: formylglycine-generating enzyme family protein, partial [Verrucomicrobiales bacterium]|nr:formylglycine-generating enzyme family protein [Verrucomicrobiales bacterium]
DVDSGQWVAWGDPIEGTGKVHTFHQGSDNPAGTFFKMEQVDRVWEGFTIAGLGLEMVRIAAGTFVMGPPADEQGIDRFEGPLTKVTISKQFWLSKYEVTQGQYEELMGSNPSSFVEAGLNAPVESVNWTDAVDFCRRLGDRERAAGRLPAGYDYWLPTEAQWEYACRAGTTTRFSFGDDPENSELVEYAWYGDGSDTGGGSLTHPVGEKLPNPWGLYDMHGNVSEWCSTSWWFWYPGGVQIDPLNPSSNNHQKILRGGSILNGADRCRSASRGAVLRQTKRKGFGFRLALVPADHVVP